MSRARNKKLFYLIFFIRTKCGSNEKIKVQSQVWNLNKNVSDLADLAKNVLRFYSLT